MSGAALALLAVAPLFSAPASLPASTGNPSCPFAPGAARAAVAACPDSRSPDSAAPLRVAAAASPDEVAVPASREWQTAAGAPAAQTVSAQTAQPAAPPAAAAYDTDLDADPSEPDFTVIDLPTNAALPKHRLAFRLTHRFARPLGEGDFSDLASDFFGFDGGAQIGFGLRFGLFRGTQLAIYRTSDRTILLHGQQTLLREGSSPVGLSAVVGVEGLNNFGLTDVPEGQTRHEFSASAGLLVSRRLGSHGAVYALPLWVGNTRIAPSAPGDEDGTLVLGLGVRLRVTKAMSLVGEVHPRLAGYAGDLGSGDADPLSTFGVEWTVGGHAFQINFSNGLGTTPAQVARGAEAAGGWYIGFNLSRKFY